MCVFIRPDGTSGVYHPTHIKGSEDDADREADTNDDGMDEWFSPFRRPWTGGLGARGFVGGKYISFRYKWASAHVKSCASWIKTPPSERGFRVVAWDFYRAKKNTFGSQGKERVKSSEFVVFLRFTNSFHFSVLPTARKQIIWDVRSGALLFRAPNERTNESAMKSSLLPSQVVGKYYKSLAINFTLACGSLACWCQKCLTFSLIISARFILARRAGELPPFACLWFPIFGTLEPWFSWYDHFSVRSLRSWKMKCTRSGCSDGEEYFNLLQHCLLLMMAHVPGGEWWVTC